MSKWGARRRKLALLILLAGVGYAAAVYFDKKNQKRRWRYRKRTPIPYQYRRHEFNLDTWPDERIRRYLWFSREEIQTLVPLLHLDDVEYLCRVKPTPECAFSVVCYRLSSPTRLVDCIDAFGRSEAWISIVFNAVTTFLDTRFSALLRWHPQLNNYKRLQAFGQAVLQDGGQGLGLIWGFIDGSFVGFCQSIDPEHQRRMYSGYYKGHGMKWQAIVTPDGLVSSLCGPWAGPVNDWTMLQESGILEDFRRVYGEKERLYVYGDPAYIGAFGIMGPYQHVGGRHALPEDEYQFNVALSSVRIAVEHAFGHIFKQWSFTGFERGMQEGLSPVAAYFSTAVLFTNCLKCFRGSQTSERFGIELPSIEEYLQ